MANYYETARTNYFRVTNEERYKELFNKLLSEDDIVDFTFTDKEGITWHGFGSYGCIDYKVSEDDFNREVFFKEMQTILPDNEALIFMASGYEKLRYVTGYSVIVTNKDIQYVDIINDAISKARMMLNNPEWDTKPDY